MSYYEDFEAPYELYERWTKGAKMSKQCPSCGGDCGYTKAKGCRQIANNPGVQGMAQLGRNALERIAELESQLAKANEAADTVEEFLSAAARHEKQASTIINSVASDIAITTPVRDYSDMSPLGCYEAGLMDGVFALKKQINEAIDAALREGSDK